MPKTVCPVSTIAAAAINAVFIDRLTFVPMLYRRT